MLTTNKFRQYIRKYCPNCNKPFTSVNEEITYCSEICRANAINKSHNKNKRIILSAVAYDRALENKVVKYNESKVLAKAPKGYYVYGWFEKGSILPFYIGKGTDFRAWRYHKTKSKGRVLPAWCEFIRTNLGRTSIVVKIFREELTNSEAKLLEDVLIDIFNQIGSNLTNKVIRNAKG